ncbi:ragulator complex protein LAMTOR5 domain-containing protein [Phthorimaea operculella]|nr:ragulator complex protein LAMTOR5 domain-containing protein [Phthorimaea operculella]
MEKELDIQVEKIMSTPNVNGCLIADHQGLCLAASGAAHVDSAGIVVAISEQADTEPSLVQYSNRKFRLFKYSTMSRKVKARLNKEYFVG